jgi:hypothetical protein
MLFTYNYKEFNVKDPISLFEQALSLGPARRGQLSEQYLKGHRKDGTEVLRGPYYVLQWYEDGRKMSRRIPAAQVPRVREELERGRQVAAMLSEAEEALWKRLAEPAQKKTVERATGARSFARSRRPGSSRRAPST